MSIHRFGLRLKKASVGSAVTDTRWRGGDWRSKPSGRPSLIGCGHTGSSPTEKGRAVMFPYNRRAGTRLVGTPLFSTQLLVPYCSRPRRHRSFSPERSSSTSDPPTLLYQGTLLSILTRPVLHLGNVCDQLGIILRSVPFKFLLRKEQT